MKSFNIVFWVIFLVSCQKSATESNDIWVAKIGDEIITASDFELDYEMGYAHMRTGTDPRMMYLESMVKERLTALAGYEIRLDTLADIRERERRLREELLVETVFKHEVIDPIQISDDEVRDAFMKSRVEFDLRAVPFSSPEEAMTARFRIMNLGFSGAFGLESEVPETHAFLHQKMGWLDVDPAFLAAVEKLPLKELSMPIPHDGQWFLIQVEDIRRKAYTEYEIGIGFDKARHKLKELQMPARASVFVSGLMNDREIHVTGTVFRRMRDHIKTLFEENRPQGNLLTFVQTDAHPATLPLREMLGDTLVHSQDGGWTVADFFERWAYTRYAPFTGTDAELDGTMNDAVALTLRDEAMMDLARKKNYVLSPEHEHEVELWRSKWVYREWVKRNIANTEEMRIDPAGIAILGDSLLALQQRYPVTYNRAVLDTMNLVDSHVTMMIYKNSNGRMAYPILDPVW